jgi:hypothetical protein
MDQDAQIGSLRSGEPAKYDPVQDAKRMIGDEHDRTGQGGMTKHAPVATDIEFKKANGSFEEGFVGSRVVAECRIEPLEAGLSAQMLAAADEDAPKNRMLRARIGEIDGLGCIRFRAPRQAQT